MSAAIDVHCEVLTGGGEGGDSSSGDGVRGGRIQWMEIYRERDRETTDEKERERYKGKVERYIERETVAGGKWWRVVAEEGWLERI